MNTAISTVNTSVPTISVTPHSPATISITPVNKQYSSVLGWWINFHYSMRNYYAI